jgi:hypothetical protein
MKLLNPFYPLKPQPNTSGGKAVKTVWVLVNIGMAFWWVEMLLSGFANDSGLQEGKYSAGALLLSLLIGSVILVPLVYAVINKVMLLIYGIWEK